MKKLNLVLILVVFYVSVIYGNSSGNEEIKKYDLIAYLTTVKYKAENKMFQLAADSSFIKKPEEAIEFVSQYNELKLEFDRLINQLIADMYVSNNLKTYKKINGYLKGTTSELPDKYKGYIQTINSLDILLNNFMKSDYSEPAFKGFTFDNFLGSAELIHGILTDARDFREKKVQSLSALIKELKLAPIKDLLILNTAKKS